MDRRLFLLSAMAAALPVAADQALLDRLQELHPAPGTRFVYDPEKRKYVDELHKVYKPHFRKPEFWEYYSEEAKATLRSEGTKSTLEHVIENPLACDRLSGLMIDNQWRAISENSPNAISPFYFGDFAMGRDVTAFIFDETFQSVRVPLPEDLHITCLPEDHAETIYLAERAATRAIREGFSFGSYRVGNAEYRKLRPIVGQSLVAIHSFIEAFRQHESAMEPDVVGITSATYLESAFADMRDAVIPQQGAEQQAMGAMFDTHMGLYREAIFPFLKIIMRRFDQRSPEPDNSPGGNVAMLDPASRVYGGQTFPSQSRRSGGGKYLLNRFR